MKLAEYQRLASLYDPSNDELSQIALIICDMFGLSYQEVDSLSARTFLKYSKKVSRAFGNVLKRPWYIRNRFNTDATKITLGQFVEVQHFVKMGEHESLHLIGASIHKARGKENYNHNKAADKLLNINVRYVLSDIKSFMLSYTELLKSYAGLFETDIEDVEEGAMPSKPHPFIERYGWLFSARQVAKDAGVTLEQAMEMPIIEALNTLAYLKSEQSYVKWQSKQQ